MSRPRVLYTYRTKQLQLLKLQNELAPFLPTVREIAECWGVATSNAWRILNVMVDMGIVRMRSAEKGHSAQYYAIGGWAGIVEVVESIVGNVRVNMRMLVKDMKLMENSAWDDDTYFELEGYKGVFDVVHISKYDCVDRDNEVFTGVTMTFTQVTAAVKPKKLWFIETGGGKNVE